jgi:hypothetical protein
LLQRDPVESKNKERNIIMLPLTGLTQGNTVVLAVDGGPNQRRWWNLRFHVTRMGGTGDATVALKVNGEDCKVPDGEVEVKVTVAKPQEQTSVHLLLKTGDQVSLEVDGGATVDVLFGGNVDTEEF